MKNLIDMHKYVEELMRQNVKKEKICFRIN